MTCCHSSNPLRRDGTSQKQRFPLALSAEYVRIDERSYEDLFNFTRALANEFLYYDLSNPNTPSTRWTGFFEQDLSFLLAQMAQLKVGSYRTDFGEKLEQAQTLLDADPFVPAAFHNALEGMFQSFLSPINTFGGDILPALPILLSEWVALLPSSDSFADDRQFSYKDLLLDGIKRLSVSMRRVQVAHAESDARAVITSPDLTGWNTLLASGWDLLNVPPTLPGDVEDYTYLKSADPYDDCDGVLQLLRTTFDTVAGMLEALQSAIPQYLEQSFRSYGLHEPQNALFVAFVLLFKHAQDHVNSLGPKHLDYYYKDVLRFAPRELQGDEAVVVIQLRKGVESHLIPAGTLLSAGKDKLGKPRYFASTIETVLSQAQVEVVKTVFVERMRSIDSQLITFESSFDELVRGVYASPIANSADGLGATLPKEEPKWSLLGEPQRGLLTRTMPDAELGFAVGSPLFMMKEGRREIAINFSLDRGRFEYYFGSLSNARAVAAFEADLAHGLRAQYTTEKGWLDAQVERLFLVCNSTVALHPDVAPQLDGLVVPNWNSALVLSIKIVLYEGMTPFVKYVEGTHKQGLNTLWPVLRFSLYNRSMDFRALDLPPFIGNNSNLGPDTYRLFGGRVYKYTPPIPAPFGSPTRIAELVLQSSLTDLIQQRITTVWSEFGNYAGFRAVQHEDEIWVTQRGDVPVGSRPELSNTDWAVLGDSVCIYDRMRWMFPGKMFIRIEVKGMAALVLENDFGKLKNNKPFQPWGAQPVVGSRFYIGAKEIFGKKLDKFTLDYVWLDPPSNMAGHYAKYLPFFSAADRAMGFSTMAYSPGFYSPVTAPLVPYNPPPFVAPPFMNVSAFNNSTVVARYVGPTSVARNAPNSNLRPLGPPAAANGNAFVPTNQHWTADFSMLYEGVWVPLSNTQRRTIFYHPGTTGLGAKHPVTITFSDLELEKFARDLDLSEPSQLNSNTPRGFLRLELATPAFGFGHKQYQDLYATEVIKAATDNSTVDPDLPGAPYLPTIKDLRISYVSRAEMDLTQLSNSPEDYEGRVEQFFHLHPFGHTEEHPHLLPNDRIQSLLPILNEEGFLYIGISNLKTPCTLSVLFQLAEGTADPDLDRLPLRWSFLMGNNRWSEELPVRKLLLDSTEGMISSGVILFELDEPMVNGQQVLDGNLHWLRACVRRDTSAYLKAIDVVAQALQVRFEDHGNEVSHLERALPAGNIKAFRTTDPLVKSVSQPYASFGGKLPELERQFVTRVSERLRHKHRSINVWDYERMVLEEFSGIYKVKCLNHTEYQALSDGRDWEISPGHVSVVCIPDLRNVNGMNPFAPKTSLRILRKVDSFLRKNISPWVDLRVCNPLYEALRINCKVGFLEGKDPGYYLLRLEEELQRYLSPWAFDHDEEIVFGGRIHRSHIIRFIEQRSYVDYVIAFKLDHQVNGEWNEGVVEAIASTGRSILVSADVHHLSSIDATCEDCLVEAPRPTTDYGSNCGCPSGNDNSQETN